MSECCFCGNQQPFSRCCKPYIQGVKAAPSPESLMRSRYSAYVQQDVDYLIATWHPTCQAENFRADIAATCSNTEWRGLNVLATSAGKAADEGFVEFAARYADKDTPNRNVLMRERSRFLRHHDRWYYVDGVHLPTGRNEACPCGSGKKYKKCCGQ
ncbi:YchJ family protein [Lonsdalea quercina]|uniref:YchJ family protein n=1 Tax=Lonsdalea quercina TaxID=71657 RepID=UPI0039751F69